jgi:hypothetical protein
MKSRSRAAENQIVSSPADGTGQLTLPKFDNFDPMHTFRDGNRIRQTAGLAAICPE